jgi:hypothetical protein
MAFRMFREARPRRQLPLYTRSFARAFLSLTALPLIPDCNYNIGLGFFGLDITGYGVRSFYPDTRIFF